MNFHIIKKINLMLAILLPALSGYAQTPTEYYKNADGKKGAELKTAMSRVIYKSSNPGYNKLLEMYHTSDKRADGKLWDMYSNTTNFEIGGSAENHQYNKEGDGYNREHSVPQSWFNENAPMKSDGFHVVPTDGYVNNRRSNYPYGEVGSATYTSNNKFSKLGTCTTTGYSGTVFEPNDEYKGDFARIYFYMVTCYENQCTNWTGNVFANNKYPGLVKWQLDMLMRWAAQDPVSKKEIDRNNAVYAHQGNRNPYVDYPGLEQYIWGSLKETEFSYNDYEIPAGYGEWNPGGGGDNPEGGDEPGGEDTPGGDTPIVPESGYLLYEPFDDIETGNADGTGGSSIAWSGNERWTAYENTFEAGGVLRIGKSGGAGSITSKTLGFAGGTLSVSMDVKGWTNVEGKLVVSMSGAGEKYLEYESTIDDDFETKTVTFSNVSANPKLTIKTSAKRAFVDNIKVWEPSTTDMSSPIRFKERGSTVIYNITGQRVDNNYKGVIIRNGRKYIRK